MTDCDPYQVNHCSTLIGYNDMNPDLPYWIIKNQWGTSWGVDGYIYLEKGVNECFINNQPTVVHVGVPAPPTPAPPTPSPTPYPYLEEISYTDPNCLDPQPNSATKYLLSSCYDGFEVMNCSASEATVQYFANSNCSGTSENRTITTDVCVAGNHLRFTRYSCHA
jgi:hypothetical protein